MTRTWPSTTASLAVALMLAACKPSPDGKLDSPAANGASDSTPTTSTTATAAAAASPTPEIDVDNMSAQQLASYVPTTDLRMSDAVTTDHRQCKGEPVDSAGSKNCNLRIVPAAGAFKTRHADLGPTGRLLAKITNLGPKTESITGLAPGTYYWFAKRIDTLTVSIMIDSATNQRVPLGNRFVKRCTEHTDQTPYPKTSVGFRECKKPGLRPLELHLTPPWISCADGCCYVGT